MPAEGRIPFLGGRMEKHGKAEIQGIALVKMKMIELP